MGCRISKCHSSLENSDKKAGSNGYLLVLWGVLRLACFFAGEASLKLKFNKKYILFALMLGYYTDIIAPIDPINLKFLKGCALLIIRGICACALSLGMELIPLVFKFSGRPNGKDRAGGGGAVLLGCQARGPLLTFWSLLLLLAKTSLQKGNKVFSCTPLLNVGG